MSMGDTGSSSPCICSYAVLGSIVCQMKGVASLQDDHLVPALERDRGIVSGTISHTHTHIHVAVIGRKCTLFLSLLTLQCYYSIT